MTSPTTHSGHDKLTWIDSSFFISWLTIGIFISLSTSTPASLAALTRKLLHYFFCICHIFIPLGQLPGGFGLKDLEGGRLHAFFEATPINIDLYTFLGSSFHHNFTMSQSSHQGKLLPPPCQSSFGLNLPLHTTTACTLSVPPPPFLLSIFSNYHF